MKDRSEVREVLNRWESSRMRKLVEAGATEEEAEAVRNVAVAKVVDHAAIAAAEAEAKAKAEADAKAKEEAAADAAQAQAAKAAEVVLEEAPAPAAEAKPRAETPTKAKAETAAPTPVPVSPVKPDDVPIEKAPKSRECCVVM